MINTPCDQSLPIRADVPWLAPLAGFSDLPFRLLCREYGCRVACTEMVSAKGVLHNSPGTQPLLATTPVDNPLVVQLFGSHPRDMAQAVNLLRERGFTHFDLNAGCPVRKVVASGSGAAMLKDPKRLVEVVAAMTDAAGSGLVGVKIRSGWERGSTDGLALAERLEKAGAGWITLHPRSAKQGFSGTADWSLIRRLKKRTGLRVIASGDLITAEDGLRCLERTGADAIMFARGALRDPAIFHRFARLREHVFDNEPNFDLVRLIRRHAELSREYGDNRRALLKMRTFVPRYLKCLPDARSLRKELTSCRSWEQLEAVLSRIPRLQDPSS